MHKKKKNLIDVHFPINFKGRYKGQFVPPRGQLPKEVKFADMQVAGCAVATKEKHYLKILKASNFNPCNSCEVWNADGWKCPAFQQFHPAWKRYQQEESTKAADHKAAITPHNLPEGHEYAGKTMKELAQILKLSLGKTTKLKQAGALEAALAALTIQEEPAELIAQAS